MEIYHEVTGDGPPLILIHGFCETQAIWKPLKNKLALTNKVYTIDLPGFGKSPLPARPFSISDVADLGNDWLAQQQFDEVFIIGHSLGGYVTLALAEHHPERLKAFGLLHSTALADDDEKKDSRNKTVEFVKKRGVQVFAESFVSQLFYLKNRQRLEKEIDEVTQIAASTSQETLISYMEAMRDRPDRTHVLHQFDNPILFIAGDQDTSVPIEKSRAQFGFIANPTIEVLAEVGHMGMYEATQETFKIISRFVTTLQDKTNDGTTAGILPDRDLKRNLGCG